LAREFQQKTAADPGASSAEIDRIYGIYLKRKPTMKISW
jgi:hypothetical protein